MKMYNLLAALIICPMLLSGMEEQYKIDSMQETIPESSICRNQYLPNGIKVYHLPAKNNELMIRLIVKTGYVTENINERNASLFVEYIMSQNLEKSLKKSNIDVNVITKVANEFTNYDIILTNPTEENTKELAEAIVETIEGMNFDSDIMTDARQEILKNLNVNASESMCAFLHNKSLYANSQYQKDFNSCIKSIKNLHFSRVKSYYLRNYIPQNMAVLLVGSLSNTTNLIESKLAQIGMPDRNEVSNLRPLPIGDKVQVSIARSEEFESNQINIVYKHLNYNIGSYEGFLQDLHCKIISNALYYRLTNSPDLQIADLNVAEKLFDSDKKALQISIVCKPENTYQVFAQVAEQISDISNNGFSKSEINNAQNITLELYANLDYDKIIQANIDNVSNSFVKGIPLFDNEQIANLSIQMNQFVTNDAVNEMSREILGGMNPVINMNVSEDFEIAESDIVKYYKNAFKANTSNNKTAEPKLSIRNK